MQSSSVDAKLFCDQRNEVHHTGHAQSSDSAWPSNASEEQRQGSAVAGERCSCGELLTETGV